MTTQASAAFFQEPVEASEPIRARQADELLAYLARVPDEVARLETVFRPDLSSPEAYESSKTSFREALLRSYSYPPPGDPDTEPASFEIVGKDHVATYYRFQIPVLPGVHSAGLHLVPAEITESGPLMVVVHGARGSPEKALFDESNEYHGVLRQLAEHGYVVWAPTHLYEVAERPANIREIVEANAREAGTTLVAIELLKIRRGLDVVLQRQEVDEARVGVLGGSYGGFYARLTAATDPRVKLAALFAATTDAPALPWAQFPELDGDALICPKPMLQVHGIADWISIDGARRAAAQTAELYSKLGFAERYRFCEFDGGHEFYSGPEVWSFLEQHFKGVS